MGDPLDRDEMIELLNRLGGDADADVLAAAKDVHGRLAAAGVTWDDLLVPQDSGEEADEEDDEGEEGDDVDYDDEVDDEPDDDAVAPDKKAAKEAETLALIDELLARSDNSEDLIEELNEYKEQIADDDFFEGDHRYVRALHQRLTKAG